MKTIFAIALSVCVLGVSAANAASLSVVKNGATYAFSLDGQASNGAFDTIFFKATTPAPNTFTNQNGGLSSGAPRPAGQAFTYPNRMLNADPGDVEGGLGLSQFGLSNAANSGELSFTVASLGGKLTTPNGGLFVANVNMPTGAGNAQWQILNAGALVAEGNLAFGAPVPEPATVALVGMGLIGLVAARRRMA